VIRPLNPPIARLLKKLRSGRRPGDSVHSDFGLFVFLYPPCARLLKKVPVKGGKTLEALSILMPVISLW
jgi:hypothetical protein